MEEIIVAVLVIGAVYWGVRLLKKEVDPDSGCQCANMCKKKQDLECKDQEDQSADSEKNNLKNQ